MINSILIASVLFTLANVEIYGITIIGGAGLGCLFSSTIIALQASVEPKDIGMLTH